MQSRLKLIGLAAATALALIVPAGAASAAEGVVLRSGSLRAGPGSDFPSVDQLSRGESIEIYGCTVDYAWCDVSNDDNRGWFPGSRVGYVEDGRRVVITEAGPSIGLAILGFSVGQYWGEHYHNRSFYNRWHRYEDFDRYGPPRGPRPGPGWTPGGPRPGPTPGWDNNGPRPGWQHNGPRPEFQQQRPRPDFQQQRPQPQFQQQRPQPQFQQQRPQPQFQQPRPQPQVQQPRPQPQFQQPRPQPQVQQPRPQFQPQPQTNDQNCGKHCVGR